MNLHSTVALAIQAVNPLHDVTVMQSTGYATAADGTRTPTYATYDARAQIQALQFSDLMAISGLQIQGLRRALYLWGNVAGRIRAANKGGDQVVFPDGSTWMVAFVFEVWGEGVLDANGWCKCCVTLQNQRISPSPPPPLSQPPSLTYRSVTANYQIEISDNGAWFDNEGATSPVVLTLPTWARGLRYDFTVGEPFAMTVVAQSPATLSVGTVVGSPGGSLSSASPYSHAAIVATDIPNVWVVAAQSGSWSLS